MEHEWEVTDTQGYSMECVNCGEHIYLEDTERWNEIIDGECEG